MSNRRYNVAFPKEGPKKTRWVRIGTAFEKEDGRIDLHVDAWPVGDFDGRLFLFPRPDAETETGPGEAPWMPPRHQAGERDGAAPGPTPDEAYEPPGERKGGFKLPEGYVHKVHFADPEGGFKGVCGSWAKKGNRVKDWAGVTCRRCREHAPADAPGPPEKPPDGDPPPAAA